ncbi:MAG: hypothetical protein HYT37_01235 [Candidatus Sungbacteria bacterium]|nr:hypothetical protein [Candidatus Sungbacteria bacterium]
MKTVGVAVLCAVFLSGCAFKLHRIEKNPMLYESPQEFSERSGLLKQGMSETELFAVMKVERGKTAELTQLDANDIVSYVRGCIQPLAPAVVANEISAECALYNGWALPYASIQPSASFGLTLPEIFELIVTTEGYDLKLIAVFRDGKLWKPFVSGRAVIGNTETYYIWDIFSGIVKGAVPQGAKEAIKAF